MHLGGAAFDRDSFRTTADRSMRFTLDTNILVYAVDQDAGDRHHKAIDLVRRTRNRDCVLTLQSLAELFRTLTSAKLRIEPAHAAALVQQWRDALPVVAADDLCLTDAMDAVTHHGWSFWDDDLGDREASRLPPAAVGGRTGGTDTWGRHHSQPIRPRLPTAARRGAWRIMSLSAKLNPPPYCPPGSSPPGSPPSAAPYIPRTPASSSPCKSEDAAVPPPRRI